MESVSVSEGGLPSKTASNGIFCCDGVATGRATRREVTKFSLMHQQVMELSIRRIPVLGSRGSAPSLSNGRRSRGARPIGWPRTAKPMVSGSKSSTPNG